MRTAVSVRAWADSSPINAELQPHSHSNQSIRTLYFSSRSVPYNYLIGGGAANETRRGHHCGMANKVEVIETDSNTMDMGRRDGVPYIKIVEQPASKALRFRYECKSQSAGSIPGINSTPENKTFPTIQIVGYRGRAVVVVSCVTKDNPHKPHPHNLVGREGCKKGLCTVVVDNEMMTQSFYHLGIQRVKKKDIEEALKARQEMRVDPFLTGFDHKSEPGSIDLNAVRLCFQAFIENEPGKFMRPLRPVVSDIIYDKNKTIHLTEATDSIKVIESDCNTMDMDSWEGAPYIKIVEQPTSKAQRFPYEFEGLRGRSIPGANSTPDNKTFPTIQIVGYKGRAVVVVSCVTKEQPHKPHPHNLVGNGCKNGICTVEVQNETMTKSFDHLSVQCVKKKDFEKVLQARQDISMDPFLTGFDHKSQPGSIDQTAVRLCFQAFIENESGDFKHCLRPVVSDIISDRAVRPDLTICKLSHQTAPVTGGMEMILLCGKVAKEDIAVRFYEESNGHEVWEGWGEFVQVHNQVAIIFQTPRYKTLQVENAVNVFIQLQRTSDKKQSDSLPFLMTPLDTEELEWLNKKHRGKKMQKRGTIEKEFLKNNAKKLKLKT